MTTTLKLGNKFSEVEIDGTLEPVNSGEKVHLILKLSNKNLRGDKVFNEVIVKSGIAK